MARHPTYTQLEARTLLDANITYTAADARWYITLFGKNLLNEEYRVSANSVGGLWNFSQYGAPLQWGVEFGVGVPVGIGLGLAAVASVRRRSQGAS